MQAWLALIVAPSIAVAIQLMLLALAVPDCGMEMRMAAHLACAAGLVADAVIAVQAWAEALVRASLLPARAVPDGGSGNGVRRVLAAAGAGVAGLSALAILAMWTGAWFLSACFAR